MDHIDAEPMRHGGGAVHLEDRAVARKDVDEAPTVGEDSIDLRQVLIEVRNALEDLIRDDEAERTIFVRDDLPVSEPDLTLDASSRNVRGIIQMSARPCIFAPVHVQPALRHPFDNLAEPATEVENAPLGFRGLELLNPVEEIVVACHQRVKRAARTRLGGMLLYDHAPTGRR